MLPYGALAEMSCGQKDQPAFLSPRIQLQASAFQGIYQKSFQPVFDKAAVLVASARSFEDHEDILYAFGASSWERDFSRPDIYIAASAILDKLYSDKKAAKKYIPVFRKKAADKKLKILSIALFIELFKSAEFYDKSVLNSVMDKIMEKSLIRAARHQMATANFHYYVNPNDPGWVDTLWISILHELGHNIRFNVLDDKTNIAKSRHVASINEFFADLCPYIVSVDKNWIDLLVMLKEESRIKYRKSKTANKGVLIDPHLASHAQWYRLLRGVSIYSSRENLPKLVAIFHAALSKEYSNSKKFVKWIYQINGFGNKLRKIMHELPQGKVSHGVEEIILADFSINEAINEGVVFPSKTEDFDKQVLEQGRKLNEFSNGLGKKYLRGHEFVVECLKIITKDNYLPEQYVRAFEILESAGFLKNITFWDARKLRFLYENITKMTNADLGRELGVNPRAISTQLAKLSWRREDFSKFDQTLRLINQMKAEGKSRQEIIDELNLKGLGNRWGRRNGNWTIKAIDGLVTRNSVKHVRGPYNSHLNDFKRDKKNTYEFRTEIVVHGRPFVVLCQIAKTIELNEGIRINFKILDENKQEILKSDTALSDIKLPEAFFLRNILPVISKQWNPPEEGQENFSIKNPHYFEFEFVSEDNQAVFPSNRIISLFKEFFTNTLKRQDGTVLDVSFYAEQTKDITIFPDSDIEELAARLGYQSSKLVSGDLSEIIADNGDIFKVRFKSLFFNQPQGNYRISLFLKEELAGFVDFNISGHMFNAHIMSPDNPGNDAILVKPKFREKYDKIATTLMALAFGVCKNAGAKAFTVASSRADRFFESLGMMPRDEDGRIVYWFPLTDKQMKKLGKVMPSIGIEKSVKKSKYGSIVFDNETLLDNNEYSVVDDRAKKEEIIRSLMFIALNDVRKHEEIDKKKQEEIAAKIQKDGYFTWPIIVDRRASKAANSRFLSDGHHRAGAKEELNVDYAFIQRMDIMDERVRVYSWAKRVGPLSKQLWHYISKRYGLRPADNRANVENMTVIFNRKMYAVDKRSKGYLDAAARMKYNVEEPVLKQKIISHFVRKAFVEDLNALASKTSSDLTEDKIAFVNFDLFESQYNDYGIEDDEVIIIDASFEKYELRKITEYAIELPHTATRFVIPYRVVGVGFMLDYLRKSKDRREEDLQRLNFHIQKYLRKCTLISFGSGKTFDRFYPEEVVTFLPPENAEPLESFDRYKTFFLMQISGFLERHFEKRREKLKSVSALLENSI